MKSLEQNFTLKLLLLLYVYIATLIYGWQILTFVSIYRNMELDLINDYLLMWSGYQIYFIVAGFISSGLCAFTLFKNKPLFEKFFRNSYCKMSRHLIFHSGLLIFLFVNYTLIILHSHLHLLQLIVFLICIYLLHLIGNVFYQSGKSRWSHPTTYGNLYISALLTGFACLLLLNPSYIDTTTFNFWILILLIFDLLILYARFRYLSRHDRVTNQIARKLMGPYLLYFGTRIIVGIFMPILYLLYAIFFDPITLKGTAVLLLMGIFLERLLFLFVMEDKPADEIGVME